jgi:hypothetical protein
MGVFAPQSQSNRHSYNTLYEQYVLMSPTQSFGTKNHRRKSVGTVPTWLWMFGVFGVLIVAQGALRKWVLPGASTPLYVAKDVTLLAALFLFGIRHRLRLTTPLRHTLLPVLWGGFAFVTILQAFNLTVPSVAVGLLGIKSYLLYTVLLFLFPLALERIARPERVLLALSLGLILPVLLLGMYQYSQPVGSWINQYVADDAQAAGVLSRPRITGPFSYISGMGSFLIFSLFFSLGLFLAGLRFQRRFYQFLGGGLLVLALIVAPMNGSRSVVLGLLVPLPFVLYAILKSRRGVVVGFALMFLTVTGAFVASESPWLTQGWEVIEHRMETASDQDTRIQTMLLDPFKKIGVGGIIGYGAGTTHPGASVLSSSGRLQIDGVYYEGEYGRVLIELGIFGAFFFLALKVWLVWTAWQALQRSRSAWTTFLSVLSFSMLFLHLGIGRIVFNHVLGALYWICAGCAVWVWSRQEVSRRPEYLTHASHG